MNDIHQRQAFPCPFFLSVFLGFLLLLGSAGHVRAQFDFGRMGVLSGDKLPAIRAKAEAWFATHGEKGRTQFERWYQFNFRQVDAQGEFPSTVEVDQGFEDYQDALDDLVAAQASASAPAITWSEIKPNGRVSGSFGSAVYQNYPGHGRVNCIRIDPANASRIYIGTAGGGVWRSTNNGDNWEPLMDGASSLKYLEIKDLLVEAGGQRLYALASSNIKHTGGNGGASSLKDSFYRSVDGGATWAAISMDATHDAREIRWTRLLADPLRPNVLYASGTGNSSDYRGLFRSFNFGLTWTHLENGFCIDDMEIETDGSTVWLHMAAYEKLSDKSHKAFFARHIITNPPGPIPMSTTSDQAAPDTIAKPDNYHLACDHHGTVYYLSAFDVPNPAEPGKLIPALSLKKSTNHGTNFSVINMLTPPQKGNGIVLNVRPGGFEVDDNNPNVLYLGAQELSRSANGGVDWDRVWKADRELYVDHNDIQFIQGEEIETVWDANDSGIQQILVDSVPSIGTVYAFSRKDNGLEVLQGNNLAVSSQNPEHIMAGWHDNGSTLYDRPTGKSDTSALLKMGPGDGQECYVNPTDKNLMYSSAQQGGITRYTDATQATASMVANTKSVWRTPLIANSANPKQLFTADSTFWSSDANGQNWQQISAGDIRSDAHKVQYIGRSKNGNSFYATYGRQISWSTNGGIDWSSRISLVGTVGGFITYLATDPFNDSRVYLTHGGYDDNRVLVSTNSGQSFTNHSKGLPKIPFTSITLDPDREGEAYASGEYGVYFNPDIRDSSSTWTIFGTGLPNVCPHEIEYNAHGQYLYAITTGRGLWRVPGQHYHDAAPYCTPRGTTKGYNIGIVKASFSPTTSSSPYVDFTSSTNDAYTRFEALSSQVIPAGSNFNLRLTPGGSSYPQRIRIWIDGGESGTFPTAPAFETTVSSNSPFDTPLVAPTGHSSFRIRVAVDWASSSSDLSPCGRSKFGEYEDYLIPLQ